MEEREPLTPVKRQCDDEDNLEDKTDAASEASPLSPEQKTRCQDNKLRAQLLKMTKEFPLLTKDIGVSWFSALQSVMEKDWFRKLSDYLVQERRSQTVYPSPSEVWSWTSRVSISEVKVVILGQDPYHGPGQVQALFSLVDTIPYSLLIGYYSLLASDWLVQFYTHC